MNPTSNSEQRLCGCGRNCGWVDVESFLRQFESRRGLVRRAVLGAAGLGLVSLAAGCGGDDDDEPAASLVTIPVAQVPPLDAAPLRSGDGKFYLVHNADGLLAFSWRCTHQGCEVPWKENEGRFHCPCHGSIFDRNGVRTDGPAPRPLDLVHLAVQPNGDLAISPNTITKRDSYDPSQATTYSTT